MKNENINKEQLIHESIELQPGIFEEKPGKSSRVPFEKELSEQFEGPEAYLDLFEFLIVAIGADQSISFINRKGCEILGYEKEDLQGKNWFDQCIATKDRKALKTEFEGVIAGKIEPLKFCELPVRKRNDEELFLCWHNAIMKDRKRNIVGILCSGEDMTGSVRVQEKLFAAEERYREIFENAIEGIYRSTPQGKFIEINSAFARIFGYGSPEEMRCSITDIGRQLYLEPDKRQEWMEFVDRQDYGRFEVRIRDKKGDIGWICLSARPVRDIEGKTIYYEGFAEDITLRKKAEEELMQYRCHLEEMVEERTLQLEKRNQQLISEIAEREKVEKALLESERELRSKAQNLMEVNTTMDVLLRTMEKDQEELKESFLANITEQVLPYLDKLKKTPLNNVQQGFIRMVESSLNEIASPFVRRLTSSYLNLTKKEIQVAALIKEGRTTKEIADLMDSSLRVIEFHRENIRKKLGIKNKKGNLQILLRSFS